jgi:hypothetical protein
MLTPVFGTSAPPRGLSGAIRKYSYATHSEGKAAHWLLLILADRVDAVEHHLQSFASLRPDNPITETGIKAEFTHNGLAARTNTKRVDRNHMWIDPILVGGPWVVSTLVVARGVKKLLGRVRR